MTANEQLLTNACMLIHCTSQVCDADLLKAAPRHIVATAANGALVLRRGHMGFMPTRSILTMGRERLIAVMVLCLPCRTSAGTARTVHMGLSNHRHHQLQNRSPWPMPQWHFSDPRPSYYYKRSIGRAIQHVRSSPCQD